MELPTKYLFRQPYVCKACGLIEVAGIIDRGSIPLWIDCGECNSECLSTTLPGANDNRITCEFYRPELDDESAIDLIAHIEDGGLLFRRVEI